MSSILTAVKTSAEYVVESNRLLDNPGIVP